MFKNYVFSGFRVARPKSKDIEKLCFLPGKALLLQGFFNVEHSPRRFAEEKQKAQKTTKYAFRISSVDNHRAKRKTLSTLNHQNA